MLWRLALVVGGVTLALACSAGYTARGATLARLQQVSHVELAWIGVDHNHPTVLYVGGSFACQSPPLGSPPCSDWALRSTDSGRTWEDLRPALRIPMTNTTDSSGGVWPVNATIDQFAVAADQSHVFAVVSEYIPDASTGFSVHAASSADGGTHWTNWEPLFGSGPGTVGLALSPVSSTRLYAFLRSCGPCSGPGLSLSVDGGRTWQARSDPLRASGNPYVNSVRLTVDPARAATVYANLGYATSGGDQDPTAEEVLRSEDGGLHWTQVISPTTGPVVDAFGVTTDAHLGRLLVGVVAGSGDRRYLSGDGGRTWRATTCPGDAGGQCPTYTVDNVLGAGAAYGFVPASPDGRIKGGIYRFHGAGPAEARLALSDHLPVRVADLLDVQAGTRAGDPIYLLAQGTKGAMQSLLYRSADEGKGTSK